MQTIIITSDVTQWALRPQLWLLEKYWKQHGWITIAGYTQPDFELPRDVTFKSIGRFVDYPIGQWSTGLLRFLHTLEDQVILFLMDDYWLYRDVDQRGIRLIGSYMETHPDVARFCVCTDRLGAAGARDYGRLGHLDVITTPPHTPYQFSYQASAWQRQALIDCLQPNETPWQSEMAGQERLGDRLVLGTRQAPMRYTIAVQQGKFTPAGGYQEASARMNDDDLGYIRSQNWIPDHA